MSTHNNGFRAASVCFGMLSIALFFGFCSEAAAGSVIKYGTMHEAIGMQEDEGRVKLGTLLERPHLFAVAALEGLRGEITVYDGRIVITTVDDEGRLQPGTDSPAAEQATLLVGAYVDSWSEHAVSETVAAEGFDAFVRDAAKSAGVVLEEPFFFTLEGEFTDVRLHVINGACPVHARMKKIDLPVQSQPFESEQQKMSGRVVGVFADNSVGSLTHPATSTHAHILFEDPNSGKTVTAHLEQVGISKGATLRLPGS